MDPLDDFTVNWDLPDARDILLNPQSLVVQDPQSAGFRNVPSATCALPSVSPLAGDYNFAAQIHPDGPDCLYSTNLNKIFVNINKNVPVKFRLNPHVTDLYVRALPVYVSSNDQQHVVVRCLTHVASDTQEGKDVELVQHVLRCTSTNSALYCSDVNSGRLSVVVPVESLQSGMDYFTVSYQFTCLNSCQNGIGRRPMGIIFTLENDMGEVLGRQFMNVRVCSCPKRDKDKEEGKTNGEKVQSTKRALKTETKEPQKKILKTEPGTGMVVKIPVKACHVKELAKFAQDLIYRDVGKEQRQLNDQDKSLLALYERIIESPGEELLRETAFSVLQE
ncbi:cellular tumor antigen p53-like [Schistocerca piceifrons]|uniref:cellular tumor antigen p53-like n=1 Tax=Schistocerca piceifrons TaxID=274613 RepID=UPI001F5F334F|nr:cellular tumor antigen p53-like [Schistocerca piceifrons]